MSAATFAEVPGAVHLGSDEGDAIVVRGLARRYGDVVALRGIDFAVPRGALCGLIGPNGAGKTTLLSILATLDDDFSGTVRIDGIDVAADPAAARRAIGFVPAHAPLYEELTVREFLVFFAAAAGVPRAARDAAVDDVIAFCGLGELVDRPAAGLSTGLTQRLCVGRALLHRPRVLLLDEPASGLDPRARIELKELLKRLARQGTTVLISSHILTELGDFCDHVVVLEQGLVKAADRVDALFGAVRAHDDGIARRRVVFELASPPSSSWSTETVAARGARALAAVRALQTAGVDIDVPLVEGALLSVQLPATAAATAAVVRALVLADVDVAAVVPERFDLQALFLTVTRGDIQ
jgi:ABC-2 type transport system ATP-binding protein